MLNLSGVLLISAYLQNGAGELVGMCWLGLCAVLGGASRGCTRRGAGVMKEAASSGWYDDESVGGERARLSVGKEFDAPSGLRARGKGLPSWKLPGPEGSSLRSGVICAALYADLGGVDLVGEPLRLRAEMVSRVMASLKADAV